MLAMRAAESNAGLHPVEDRELADLRRQIGNLRLSLEHLPPTVDAVGELRVRLSILVGELCDSNARRIAAASRHGPGLKPRAPGDGR